MSTAELLARLARLDARDRAWLLGELPAAMRRELATLLADEPESPAAPAGAASPDTWESLDAQRLAGVLDGEPAWLVSAAIRGCEPRWRERLLQSMGVRRRHEIELADRTGGKLSVRAVACVRQGCRARLDASSGAAAPAAQGFAALLERMKGRFS
jgi:hypothetical protein